MSPHPLVLLRFDRVPIEDDWLTAREQVILRSFRREARRRAWRAGRYAAKQLLGGPPLELEVLADDEGAPRVFRGGKPCPGTIALSHREGWAAAAGAEDRAELGVDVEWVEPRTDRFVRDFFTRREAEAHAGLAPPSRDRFAALVWSAKESALKCARTGLRRDTRTVEVQLGRGGDLLGALASSDGGEVEGTPAPGDWRPLTVRDHTRAVDLAGGWSRKGRLILTLLAPT